MRVWTLKTVLLITSVPDASSKKPYFRCMDDKWLEIIRKNCSKSVLLYNKYTITTSSITDYEPVEKFDIKKNFFNS